MSRGDWGLPRADGSYAQQGLPYDVDLVADRRQRAREAFDDVWSKPGRDLLGPGSGWAERLQHAREEAIETATRVKITEDVIAAAVEVGDLTQGTKGAWRTLAAAFRAAGFEVEE